MKLANNINIRVFCKKEEDETEIRQGLLKIMNFNEEELIKEKLKITRNEAKGFDEKIIILEILLEKERHTNKTLENIKEKLTEQDKELLREQENRLDVELDFYMRLSKTEIQKNNFELTDTGECYHIKINIAAYPKNKETAKQKINEIFS
jgi:RNA binding exosome subunit